VADDPNAARSSARKRRAEPAEDAQAPVEDAQAPVGDAEPTDAGATVDDAPAEIEPAAETAALEPAAESQPDAEPEPIAAQAEPTAPLDDWTAEEVAAESEADAATTLWASPVPEPSTWLPWLQARSPDDRICPFLRAVADDDSLGFPVESPDPANRCAAMHEAVPQSLRQQELVCLTATHVNCPRYLRGAVVASEVAAPRVRTKAVLTPAISASLIILALSFGASVVFGLANGGLTMPSNGMPSEPAASASAVAAGPSAAATTGPTRSPAPSVAPSAPPAVASASPSILPSPSASASATPTPTPAPTPSPSSTAVARATPIPTSGRYKLLKPCPDKPDCWIYTIRSGDNLYSIAKYFGVPLSKVKALNAWTKTESLRAGKKLILPPPTR
jgi:LysM repeat protein